MPVPVPAPQPKQTLLEVRTRIAQVDAPVRHRERGGALRHAPAHEGQGLGGRRPAGHPGPPERHPPAVGAADPARG